MAIGSIFSTMNVGGANSQVIYEDNTGEKLQRRIFLKQLSLQLIKSKLIKRAQISTFPLELHVSIRKIAGIKEALPTNTKEKSDGYCYICPRKNNRKTKKICKKCGNPICTEHTLNICVNCDQEEIIDF